MDVVGADALFNDGVPWGVLLQKRTITILQKIFVMSMASIHKIV